MFEIFNAVTEWLTYLGQFSMASGSILLAIAIYAYTFMDPRLPWFIVTPIIALLVYFGGHTFGETKGVAKEKAACVARIDEAKRDLLDRYGKAALTLHYIEKQYDESKKEMSERQQAYENELQEMLVTLNTYKDQNDDKTEPTIPRNYCLGAVIPDSIVRNLNKSRR